MGDIYSLWGSAIGPPSGQGAACHLYWRHPRQR